MKLEIVTPDRTLYSGLIDSLVVPGSTGEFMVLNNHAPIISTLSEGKIKIVNNKVGTKTINILGGIIQVKKNQIIVLADI